MKRKIILTALILFCTCLAWSQEYTTITATDLQVDNGSGGATYPPNGSTLCFLGVNNLGATITYTPNGGSPVTGPVCGTLNSTGGLTATLQVGNAALAQPPGLLYTVTIANGSTTYLTIPLVSVQGVLFSMDGYALPGQGTAIGVGYPHLACNAGAQWTSNTLPVGQNAATCNQGGSWVGYPPNYYCPAGTAYLTAQSGGPAMCTAPESTGAGAPTGLCIGNSLYFQSDGGGVIYGCFNGAWSPLIAPGTAGLTSFQGRTTAAATLQYGDVVGILTNSPFGMTGTQGLIYDSAAGTPNPSANWVLGTGANLGQLYGYQNLNLAPNSSSSSLFTVTAATGAVSAAGGAFTVSSAGVAAAAAGSTVSGSPICTPGNALCAAAAANYYQTVQNATVAVTQRTKMNFVNSTGIVAADNSGNASTDVSLSAIPNASLTNSSVTINVGTGLIGGAAVALGGSVTLSTSAIVPLINIANTFTTTQTLAGIIDSGLSAGTSPICPNGTGGLLTTVGCSVGAVSSVFGRTGAVVAATGDYTAAQVTNAADVTAANTFRQNQTIQQQTPATSSTNYSSPSFEIGGTYWNGSASANDVWTCIDSVESGTNPQTVLDCTQSGSSQSGGFATFSVPNLSTSNIQSSVIQNTGGIYTYTSTPANNGTNYSSPPISWKGNYWNGSTSALSSWSCQNLLGTGTNPTSTLACSQAGTPGVATFSIPNLSTGAINASGAYTQTGSGANTFSGGTNFTGGSVGINAIGFYINGSTLGAVSGNASWQMAPTATATSSNNYSSTTFDSQASYWTGTLAQRAGFYTQANPATGNNPLVTLAHTFVPQDSVAVGGTATALETWDHTISATGYDVGGTPLAASNLSNGTTGSGAVVLAAGPAIASPTLTGTTTAATVNATTLQLGATATITSITTFTFTITPTSVPASSCSDEGFTVSGLTTADQITSLRPPSTLGNVSMSPEPAGANTLVIHFCNPTSASVTPPAGTYQLMGIH